MQFNHRPSTKPSECFNLKTPDSWPFLQMRGWSDDAYKGITIHHFWGRTDDETTKQTLFGCDPLEKNCGRGGSSPPFQKWDINGARLDSFLPWINVGLRFE
ncbi:hypothetical protein CDAR_173271 [Caerostris darwini]|uniref:Uncharacterized protein n=1 Tax=Caerostris darwini TaxID=1538125 RepID=A0AAV4WIS8_9ARAC|nr:hypothetical protein CDAR_173271 [Caerostris darwini]